MPEPTLEDIHAQQEPASFEQGSADPTGENAPTEAADEPDMKDDDLEAEEEEKSAATSGLASQDDAADSIETLQEQFHPALLQLFRTCHTSMRSFPSRQLQRLRRHP